MKILQTLIFTLFITAIFSNVDVVAQPKSPQPQEIAMDKGEKVKTPTLAMTMRGKTMDKVKQQFGAAKTELPPVGEPPITRWQYENCTVYFEHDRVITSVFHETVSDQTAK